MRPGAATPFRKLIVGLARLVPQPIVRAIGRRTGSNRLFGFLDRTLRSSFAGAGAVTIPRGAAEGLKFDAVGARAGFALGTWEPEVQSALIDLLSPGKVVWDVGAASGFYAIIAARLVGATGAVVAFEPLPENLERLHHNVALNGFENVTIVDVALSTAAGRAVMVAEAEDDEVSIQMVEAPTGSERGVEVTVASADELVARGTPVPSLIKMDVEGAEIEVLRGAPTLLADHRPLLLIEVHGRWNELDLLLAELGYDYRGIEQDDPRRAGHATHILATPTARA